MKLSNEMKQMLDENIVYLATSTQEGKPNVVPIGLIHAISDEEILIGDVLFNKTKKNLEENQLVAISFTDIRRLESYQLKGKTKIYKSGKFFDMGLDIMEKKKQKRRESIKQVNDPKINERASRLSEMHRRLKLKAVVLITVEEIYSHIPKFKGHE